MIQSIVCKALLSKKKKKKNDTQLTSQRVRLSLRSIRSSRQQLPMTWKLHLPAHRLLRPAYVQSSEL